jgi:hypothetical protein
VTRIWERIYVGNLKDAELLARSNPERIATVMSLTREQAGSRAPSITYIHIPIPDSRPLSAQNFEDSMFAAWMQRCGYAGIDKALSEIGELRELAPSRTLLKSVKELLSK